VRLFIVRNWERGLGRVNIMRETCGTIFFTSVAALFISPFLPTSYWWIVSVASIIGICIGLLAEAVHSHQWNDGNGYGA
jgi:hypothetical protein